ncbi:MAG: major capsid protein [Rhabdochlamydiaceae bacterium]
MANAIKIQNPTLIDVAKERDSEGKLLPHIYALSQANAWVNWLTWLETNQARSHMVSVETSAPLPSTRILNRGVDSQYGTWAQIEETVAQIKDWVEVDEDAADYGGDPESFRVRQAQGRLRAMGRKFTYLSFYGNRGANPGDLNGLTMRFNALTDSPNSQNVLNAGGTTANGQLSIWLIGFGPYALSGIFPKGSVAGMHHRDWGLRPKTNAIDSAGNAVGKMAVYLDEFTMDCGIFPADWRHLVRIANVDTAALNTQTGADLTFFLDEAIARLPEETNLPPETGVESTKPSYAFFMPRTAQRNLRHQIKQTVIAGSGLAKDGYERAYNPQFMWDYSGIRIGINDQMLLTESVVS